MDCLIKISRLRLCVGRLKHCMHVTDRSHLLSTAVSKDSIDIEECFLRPDVQNILTRITQFNVDKIFREKKVDNITEPTYKLLTNKQLEESTVEAIKRGQELLQMPPVKRPWKSQSITLSDDDIAKFDKSDCRYVFTDISYGLPRRVRTVSIRDAEGQLRLANLEERDRILNVYFPSPGKMPVMPKMFEESQLEKLLTEHRYEYVLDRACIQFEPDDPTYMRVTHRTYQHIANHGRFDELRSTRHFGPMTFYLALSNTVDSLIVDMLQRQFLSDAADVIRLVHILHPEIPSAVKAKSQQIKDDQQLIAVYAELESSEKTGKIALALQSYLDVQTTS